MSKKEMGKMVMENNTSESKNTQVPTYLFYGEDGKFSPYVNFGDQEGVLMSIIDNQIHAVLCYDGVYVQEVEAVLKGKIEYKIAEGEGSLKDIILPMISIDGMAQLFRFSSYIDPGYVKGMNLSDEVCIMLVDISANRVAALRNDKMPKEYKRRLQEVWDLNKMDMLSDIKINTLYEKTMPFSVNQIWDMINKKY